MFPPKLGSFRLIMVRSSSVHSRPTVPQFDEIMSMATYIKVDPFASIVLTPVRSIPLSDVARLMLIFDG